MSPFRLLKEVISKLEISEIPYMLTGSIVSSLQGVPRSTNDIDFVISISEKDIYLSVSMMKKYEQLLSRDAIIIANMLNNDIIEIISVDKDFDKVSEINRMNPEELEY